MNYSWRTHFILLYFRHRIDYLNQFPKKFQQTHQYYVMCSCTSVYGVSGIDLKVFRFNGKDSQQKYYVGTRI